MHATCSRRSVAFRSTCECRSQGYAGLYKPDELYDFFQVYCALAFLA